MRIKLTREYHIKIYKFYSKIYKKDAFKKIKLTKNDSKWGRKLEYT